MCRPYRREIILVNLVRNQLGGRGRGWRFQLVPRTCLRAGFVISQGENSIAPRRFRRIALAKDVLQCKAKPHSTGSPLQLSQEGILAFLSSRLIFGDDWLF